MAQLNIGTQSGQELFFLKQVAALSGLLIVMIKLIQQVCLVTMYCKKKKTQKTVISSLHYIYQGLVLTVNQ